MTGSFPRPVPQVGDATSARVAEWGRNHGLGGLVDWLEARAYSTPPSHAPAQHLTVQVLRGICRQHKLAHVGKVLRLFLSRGIQKRKGRLAQVKNVNDGTALAGSTSNGL